MNDPYCVWIKVFIHAKVVISSNCSLTFCGAEEPPIHPVDNNLNVYFILSYVFMRAIINALQTQLEKHMLAQRKTEIHHSHVQSEDISLHDGSAVEAFTSSLSPVSSGDALSGEAVEAFTSSLGPVTASESQAGDAVEAFTSSLAPTTTADLGQGDAVELFTSSLGPVQASTVTEGNAVELFTSSLGPVRASQTQDGDAVHAFTSSL